MPSAFISATASPRALCSWAARIGRGGHEAGEGRLAPGDEPVRRLLADHLAAQLRVGACLGQRPFVLDHVLWRFHDDGAGDVEPGPACPTGDLVELPGRQGPDPL